MSVCEIHHRHGLKHRVQRAHVVYGGCVGVVGVRTACGPLTKQWYLKVALTTKCTKPEYEQHRVTRHRWLFWAVRSERFGVKLISRLSWPCRPILRHRSRLHTLSVLFYCFTFVGRLDCAQMALQRPVHCIRTLGALVRGVHSHSHADFLSKGFTVIPNFISAELADKLAARVPTIFAGNFDTVLCCKFWLMPSVDVTLRDFLAGYLSR